MKTPSVLNNMYYVPWGFTGFYLPAIFLICDEQAISVG